VRRKEFAQLFDSVAGSPIHCFACEDGARRDSKRNAEVKRVSSEVKQLAGGEDSRNLDRSSGSNKACFGVQIVLLESLALFVRLQNAPM
jgi:hypothetical protein